MTCGLTDELHRDAVRISGRDPDRPSVAAQYAAEAGLDVWFAPFPVDRTAPGHTAGAPCSPSPGVIVRRAQYAESTLSMEP